MNTIAMGTFVRIIDEGLAGYVGDIVRVTGYGGGFGNMYSEDDYSVLRKDGFQILGINRKSFSVLSPAEQVAQTLMWTQH